MVDKGSFKKTASVIAFAGVLLGFFFLSGNITGLSIIGMENSTSTSVGTILLVIGVVAGFAALRKR